MTNSVPMTTRGFEMLKAELNQLKYHDRQRIVRDIEEAREHGDLSENAEYDEAKNAQGLLEARIRDIEQKLAGARVIDTSTLSGDKVVFGATVTMENIDSGAEVIYRIVGADEADAKRGLLSIESPVAQALIGKHVGDLARVRTPGGLREFEVTEVKF
ncbi:MAG: transcription elongation factor GreA [Candidatus Alcyoniella australis]|nr:transcription elongation factor GreA [Candidatus Alcyoniella australis]